MYILLFVLVYLLTLLYWLFVCAIHYLMRLHNDLFTVMHYSLNYYNCFCNCLAMCFILKLICLCYFNLRLFYKGVTLFILVALLLDCFCHFVYLCLSFTFNVLWLLCHFYYLKEYCLFDYISQIRLLSWCFCNQKISFWCFYCFWCLFY